MIAMMYLQGYGEYMGSLIITITIYIMLEIVMVQLEEFSDH
ncbi:MAG: hypothetical protein QMD61_05750 [Methanobacterium sp.]|nr:hypothetical protein [Methanobacterium sp.]